MLNGADGQAALIIAHPGHELLLHHWMERTRPVVFVLTDGSGGSDEDRRDYSRRVIEDAGGSIGSVFGPAKDRDWYQAILDGDARPFFAAMDDIVAACVARRVVRMVTDAAELFNPMHDLCSALACGVVRRLNAEPGMSVELLDFAIESDAVDGRSPAVSLDLDPAAVDRKRLAAGAYGPLAAEVAARNDPRLFSCEALRPVDPYAVWPMTPTIEPFYERFGRERVGEQVYDRLITYVEHVRPLAAALSASPRALETKDARDRHSRRS